MSINIQYFENCILEYKHPAHMHYIHHKSEDIYANAVNQDKNECKKVQNDNVSL